MKFLQTKAPLEIPFGRLNNLAAERSGLGSAAVLLTDNHVATSEDMVMRTTLDFAPLFRSTIGFDRLFDVLDNAHRGSENNWPPYDIVKIGEDAYQITMAVAGFDPSELTIEQKPNLLLVSGMKKETEAREYLHRGIAGRPFERRFELADFVRVDSATVEHGLLNVKLVRELPEAMKPRRINIQSSSSVQTGLLDSAQGKFGDLKVA